MVLCKTESTHVQRSYLVVARLTFAEWRPGFRGFILKQSRKTIGCSKIGCRSFQNSTPFEGLVSFYVTISGKFERLWDFNFETNFLINEKPFQKLECYFLVESATFPYKNTPSKANVKMIGEYKMDLSQKMEFCQCLL